MEVILTLELLKSSNMIFQTVGRKLNLLVDLTSQILLIVLFIGVILMPMGTAILCGKWNTIIHGKLL